MSSPTAELNALANWIFASISGGTSYLQRALNYTQQAKSAGKRVTISECWLYKASPSELATGGGLGNAKQIMDRDFYSFWETEDQRFIQDIAALGRNTGMDFISFFWARNFFAYLGVCPTNSS